MVKVSIIVPTYNVEQYLRECLDSIVNQTLKEIEVICVNDGSTDGSLEILKEYAEKDNRIIIIDKVNTGYGNSMNCGLDKATGEYIGIVEPDDYVQLDMYETLYNIAKQEDLDLIKADFARFIGEPNNRTFTINYLTKDKSYYNRVINPVEEKFVLRAVMNTWSGIYKREFLNKFNIRHNETPGASFQDNGFWFQTFTRAERIYFLDRTFYMNRRDNVNSSVKSKDKVYCMNEEYAFIKEYLNANPKIKEEFLPLYTFKRYHNYLFTYKRISPIHRLEYCKVIGKEFKEALENNEIDWDLFSDAEQADILMLCEQPELFHLQIQIRNEHHYMLDIKRQLNNEIKKRDGIIKKQQKEIKKLKKQVNTSFGKKVKKVVLYIPRKIKRLIQK